MIKKLLIILIFASFISCAKNQDILPEDDPQKDCSMVETMTLNIEVSDIDGHNLMDIADERYIGKQIFLEYNGKRMQMKYTSYPDSAYRMQVKGMNLAPVLCNGVYNGKDVLCVFSVLSASTYYSGDASFQIIWPDESVDSLRLFKNEAYLRPNYMLYLNGEAHPFDDLYSPPVLRIVK